MKKRVVVVGAGFAGINCVKRLGKNRDFEITVIDRRNHHLFQPLLYQVAMAGLSPADIAVPIRSLLSHLPNVRVIQANVDDIALDANGGGIVRAARHEFPFDYLVLAAGAEHAYFGHESWEARAPGLKSLEQATEIRRRVLSAFELAELSDESSERRSALTFVVVGGGPTGVELAGAIGEMSRYTLSLDFRRIDPKQTRIVLIEAGPRILPSFSAETSARAARDLERLGVQVWTESRVTNIDEQGVDVGDERIAARTVLWAAGVSASPTGALLPAERDRAGRVIVESDLSIAGHPWVFVLGDQAQAKDPVSGAVLPGVATVALQQGRFVADTLIGELRGKARRPFHYFDKGQLATIGRRRAVLESGKLRMSGVLAWLAWLLVHIYYLSGFRNRMVVLLEWAWSYLTFARGARLIVSKTWRSYGPDP